MAIESQKLSFTLKLESISEGFPALNKQSCDLHSFYPPKQNYVCVKFNRSPISDQSLHDLYLPKIKFSSVKFYRSPISDRRKKQLSFVAFLHVQIYLFLAKRGYPITEMCHS